MGHATVLTPDLRGNSLLQRTFEFFLPHARAEVNASLYKELIDNLTSDNALVRRESRQLLAAKGIAAVKPVMAALAASPTSYRLQLGAVVMLSEMLNRKVKAAEIRMQLTDENIRQLARLVAHDNETMRQSATETMTLLADPVRSKPFLRSSRVTRTREVP